MTTTARTTWPQAAELQSAADTLRERAQRAAHENRTTWSTGNTLGSKSPVVVDDQEEPSVLIETFAARLEAVNRYVATVDPAAGLAVADLLDGLANALAWLAPYREHEPGYPMWEAAVALARAINGPPAASSSGSGAGAREDGAK